MFSCSQKIGKQGIKIFFIVNLTSEYRESTDPGSLASAILAPYDVIL